MTPAVDDPRFSMEVQRFLQIQGFQVQALLSLVVKPLAREHM
jgi:hypothetical protein